MFHHRETVSPEALKRAIRARLAARHGVDSPLLLLPLEIHGIPAETDGVNWELMRDAGINGADGLQAAQIAANEVAHQFNLD